MNETQISLRISRELVKDADGVARQRRWTRSEVVREALARGLRLLDAEDKRNAQRRRRR